MTWLKQKLRPLFFKAWEWTYDDDEEDWVYYVNGDRRVCPGAGCNDPSCPSWG